MRRRKSTKVTYDITGKVLVKYLDKTAVSFTVPDGIEKIADRAFAECRNIKRRKIGDILKLVFLISQSLIGELFF